MACLVPAGLLCLPPGFTALVSVLCGCLRTTHPVLHMRRRTEKDRLLEQLVARPLVRVYILSFLMTLALSLL